MFEVEVTAQQAACGEDGARWAGDRLPSRCHIRFKDPD